TRFSVRRPARQRAARAAPASAPRWPRAPPSALRSRAAPPPGAGGGAAGPPSGGPMARRPCVRYVRMGVLRTSGNAGGNKLYFSGRIGRRVLHPGRYPARANAPDLGCNRSAARRATFRVVRGRPTRRSLWSTTCPAELFLEERAAGVPAELVDPP